MRHTSIKLIMVSRNERVALEEVPRIIEMNGPHERKLSQTFRDAKLKEMDINCTVSSREELIELLRKLDSLVQFFERDETEMERRQRLDIEFLPISGRSKRF